MCQILHGIVIVYFRASFISVFIIVGSFADSR